MLTEAELKKFPTTLTSSVLHVARLLGILDASLMEQAKTLAERVVAMLSKLCRPSS